MSKEKNVNHLLSQYFKTIGSKGGKESSKDPEEMSKRGKKGAAKRWKKEPLQ